MKDTKKEKKQLIVFCTIVGIGLMLKAFLYGENIRFILGAIGLCAVLFSIYQIAKWYDKEE